MVIRQRRSALECACVLADSAAPPVRALGELAVAAPLEPAVFFQEGLDWRYLDRGGLAERVAEAHARLVAGRELHDVVVGYPSRADPPTLVLDLALQHAGAVPGPRRAPFGAPRPPGAWVADARTPLVEGDLGAVAPGAVERWRAAARLDSEAVAAGCSRPLSGRGRWARRLGLAEPREVVVDVLGLERPLCRAGVVWTLQRGGALVLAHERGSLATSARWARPTRLWAETGEARFDALIAAVLGGGSGRASRLVSVLWSGLEAPTADTLAALATAGVAVARFRGSLEADEPRPPAGPQQR